MVNQDNQVRFSGGGGGVRSQGVRGMLSIAAEMVTVDAAATADANAATMAADASTMAAVDDAEMGVLCSFGGLRW